MSVRLINHNLLKTILSNFKKNFFKSTRRKLRNKFLLEKIIQNNIVEINYMTKGKEEIILWYKNFDTKDRHIISLNLKDIVKTQDHIDVKNIIQFDNIFILSISNYLLKTDLKTISLIYTCDEENFILKKLDQAKFVLFTSNNILHFQINNGDVKYTEYKNPLNRICDIFVIQSNNNLYLLKINKSIYSLVNISNHNDTKILKLKGLDGELLKDILEADGNHFFIYKTFIAKYNIKENQFLDLYTTEKKIVDFFINNEQLVLTCRRSSNTYLLNLANFSVVKRLIFPHNGWRSTRFAYNDYIVFEGDKTIEVYQKDYKKVKVIPMPYPSMLSYSYKVFNVRNEIISFNSNIVNQKLEFYCLPMQKENIKLNISEIGDASLIEKVHYLKENFIGLTFPDQFIIYNYKLKKIHRVLTMRKPTYLGNYSTYKLLFYEHLDLMVYDLTKDATFKYFNNIEIMDFRRDSSKFLVTGKYFIFSEGDCIFINSLKMFDPYQLDTSQIITGLYKHCNSDKLIVTFVNGFNIFSLRERGFLGDIIVLNLVEVRIINAVINSWEIVFLASSGVITYNLKSGGIDYIVFGKPYEDIVSISEESIILLYQLQCEELSLADFTCLSKFKA
jgi:hypothetical protein